MPKYKTILSIAGSDPTAGAGIQADIKAASNEGVYALTAITALTIQNGLGFYKMNPVSSDILDQQIKTILQCVKPDAVKIGLLPSVESVKIVANAIESHQLKNVVIDPVITPTLSSNNKSNNTEIATAILNDLLPLTDLCTPNVKETKLLLNKNQLYGFALPSLESAALITEQTGCKALLVKGGDSDNLYVTDTYYNRLTQETCLFVSHKIKTNNTHGTGCVLSSIIASKLALGYNLTSAIASAEKIVQNLLKQAVNIQLGNSPYGPFIK